MAGISDTDLNGLSAQEREFIESQGDDEETAAAFGLDAADDPVDAETDGEDNSEDHNEADAQTQEKEGPGEGEESGQEREELSTEQEKEEPQIDTDHQAGQKIELQPVDVTPKDAADQRKMLLGERAAAMARMMNGELTTEEFSAIDTDVQDKLDAIVRAQAVDQARVQVSQDMMLKDYGAELQAVLARAKAAGLTDVSQPGSDANAAFDRAVRMFAQDATARGLKDVPGDLAASRDALNEALEYVLRRSGKSEPVKAKEEPVTEKPKPRAPVDRSKLPPTLSSVPVAADAAVGAGEFSHLANLEGSALERALAKLSPEQMERYLDA